MSHSQLDETRRTSRGSYAAAGRTYSNGSRVRDVSADCGGQRGKRSAGREAATISRARRANRVAVVPPMPTRRYRALSARLRYSFSINSVNTTTVVLLRPWQVAPAPSDTDTDTDTDRVPSHTLGRGKRDDQYWRSPSRTFSWSAYDEIQIQSLHTRLDEVGRGKRVAR